jgi:galactose oxidase-like protein/Kelch motif protein
MNTFRRTAVLLAAVAMGSSCVDDHHHGGDVTHSSETFHMLDSRSKDALAILDNGDVLVVGGFDRSRQPLASAEVFDVSRLGTDDDVMVPVGSMSVPRARLTAVTLASGEVLVAGGSPEPLAERFVPDASSPENGHFVPTAGGLRVPRVNHGAVRLGDGRVLVAGGDDALSADPAPLASAEIFDPATDSFADVASMSVPRSEFTLTRLPDGRVLAAGGRTDSGDASSTAELFDPRTNTWTRVSEANGGNGELAIARFAHAAVLLASSNRVVLAGGTGVDGEPIQAVEIFDPASATFTFAGYLAAPASTGIAGAAMIDGEAVFLGGRDFHDDASKEAAVVRLLVPTQPATAGIQDLRESIAEPIAVGIPLSDSHTGTEILIAGGLDADDDPLGHAILFDPFGFDLALENTLDDQEAMITATLLTLFSVLDDERTGKGSVDLEVEDDPVNDTVVHGDVGDAGVGLSLDAGAVVGAAANASFSIRVEDGVVSASDLEITFTPERVSGFLDPNVDHFTVTGVRTASAVDGEVRGTHTLRSASFRLFFANRRTDPTLSTVIVR